jgi:hypothetical protein
MDIFFIVVVEKEWLANQGLHLAAEGLGAETERRARSRVAKANPPDKAALAFWSRRDDGIIGFKHSIDRQFYAGKQGCSRP